MLGNKNIRCYLHLSELSFFRDVMNACIFMHVLCIAFAVKYKFHFLACYLKVIVDLRRKGRSEFWAWFLPRFPDFYPADMRLFCIGFSWPPSIFFFWNTYPILRGFIHYVVFNLLEQMCLCMRRNKVKPENVVWSLLFVCGKTGTSTPPSIIWQREPKLMGFYW